MCNRIYDFCVERHPLRSRRERGQGAQSSNDPRVKIGLFFFLTQANRWIRAEFRPAHLARTAFEVFCHSNSFVKTFYSEESPAAVPDSVIGSQSARTDSLVASTETIEPRRGNILVQADAYAIYRAEGMNLFS